VCVGVGGCVCVWVWVWVCVWVCIHVHTLANVKSGDVAAAKVSLYSNLIGRS
jgi:hypothetical protein